MTQVFDDVQRCSVESLISLLDKEHAEKTRLDLGGYHQAVEEFCHASKQEDKLLILAFDEGSNSPASMVLMKKSYDPNQLTPLPRHSIEADMTRSSRKLFWEVS